MKATLKLPYNYYNDGSFDVDPSYYKDGEYGERMNDEFNKTSESVYNAMSDSNKCVSRAFLSRDGQSYRISEKTSYSEDKVAYSQCMCDIYDVNGNDKSIDSFVSDVVSNDRFVLVCNLSFSDMDEEFETELLSWLKEHKSINSYADANGDDWVLANEPTRELFVSFNNKSDVEVDVVLHDCKIMDIVDDTMIVLYVDNSNFLENLNKEINGDKQEAH